MRQISKNCLLLSKLNASVFRLSLLFSLVIGHGHAQSIQNLVPNGSFETFTQCPTGGSQLYRAVPWTGPIVNSTDYYNSCSQGQNVPYFCGVSSTSYPCYLPAKNGLAYIGLWNFKLNNVREYAQVKLIDTLKNGQCYYVEFYATNSVWVKYKTNNVAAAFSGSNYTLNTSPPYLISNLVQHITNYGNPILRDTVKWEKISGVYNAQGNEAYMLLGNFKNDSSTDTVNVYLPSSYPYSHLASNSYVFIDAVSVYSINPNGPLPWSYRDTTINKGDSVFIGNKMGGLNFHPQWFTSGGAYIKTNAGITVSPTVTTKYVVQYTLCGVQRTDTVKVTVPREDDTAIQKFLLLNDRLKIFPVPAGDILELRVDDEKLSAGFHAITIYDHLGQMVREEEVVFKNGNAKVRIDQLDNGMYFLSLPCDKLGTVMKRFVVSR